MYMDFSSIDDCLKQVTAYHHKHPGLQMILLSDAHQHIAKEITAAIDAEQIKFFGGIFPGLIAGNHLKEAGLIMMTLPERYEPVIASLDESGISWRSELPGLDSDDSGQYSAFVLTDALAPHTSEFLFELYHEYGNTLQYFGAACGNADISSAPSVFTNDGVFSNAAIVAICKLDSLLTAKHGWRRFHGPLVASKTSGKIIEEINWEPAAKVYGKYLPERLQQYFDHENQNAFYQKVASHYPFGIAKEQNEDLVRDIWEITRDGGLACSSEVPQNSVLHILEANSDNLITAARDAVAAHAQHSSRENLLVFDCYSRMLHLGMQFPVELQTIYSLSQKMQPHPRVEGAITLGEIASDGSHLLQMLNKTCITNLIA